ncbi:MULTISPECIES: helix-turn-helix domain-containing protein [Phocoenobacter]|uniref:Helix-turn-helix n=1 Tax=Phocoenobacter skyensis TaxID=97481 RepID=A0A1H7WXS4_9PAST|nr:MULTISPECIES: helix-turn-helix transcriptional regulator [Pasteurella]MDP8079292.1 helix-turn-helix transcriptional regulator [Pasteurella skyensis]MDP8085487.1 helix-turn-helix transcriptional regulator [Pasteurella skyensis]MDP8101085.1 helix-turn-helix transcriptional regulator [Pasteurella atlantica]MDP8185158.1 helix-turn-helix transcriptional regulator [Pasteurella skyensis]QLB21993.1 transcriptional regulator [Pasteurella skyensis]
MKKLRSSIHSYEQQWLRELFINQRKRLGLSQRALAEKMGVVYSLIGKIETGDRRLDIIEFIQYCEVLELDPQIIIDKLSQILDKSSPKR